MEISSEKIKVMVNSNDSSLYDDITLNDNKLEEVNTLCYLGETLSTDGSCETDETQNTASSCNFSYDTTIYYMEQPLSSNTMYAVHSSFLY